MSGHEFYLIRTISGFQLATEQDHDAVSAFKIGDVIRVSAQKPRNGGHHRKGFALLQLGFNYWEGSASFLTAGERAMARFIADRLDCMAGGSGVIIDQIMELVKELESNRKRYVGEIEKSFNAYRRDITVKTGHYEIEKGPSGIVKTPKSLSYDKMPQEAFNDWYKAAFGVIWNETLSKHFSTESEAESAVNQMIEFI